MSIIHEALKKIEGARHGYTGVHAGRVVPARRPPRKTTVALAIVTFFVFVSAAIYTAWHEKKPSAPAQDNSQGQITQGEPSPQAAASQPQTPAVTTGPQSQSWTDSKGVDLFNQGRYSEAAAEFDEGVRQEPENSVRLNNLGLAYFRSGKIADAEGAYKKALAINSAYPEALNNYGALFVSRADYGRAMRHYKAAIALKPDYAEAYLNSAIANELSGDLKTAVGDYERFLNTATDAKDAVTVTEVRKKLLKLRPALIIEDVKDARR